MMSSEAARVASASKSGGLSSCRSRWYASGSPLSVDEHRREVADHAARARPRTSSAGSGFFLFGIIDDPVEKASASRT